MRRGVRILIVTVVVLAGLFVAADRIAVSYAQSRAASSIQSSQGLTSEPSVSIKGFPFLTQVLRRELREVTVTADDVETAPGTTSAGDGRLRLSRLTADLHDVVLKGHFTGFVADTATGTALVSYADLSQDAPEGVTVSYGGENAAGTGQVKVTGSIAVPVLGTLRRSVTSEVHVSDGDTVSLHADSVPDANTVPGLDKLVRSKIDFSRRLSGLPSSITLKSVTATPAGVEISLSGRDVSLTR
jgi:hypothetical protein